MSALPGAERMSRGLDGRMSALHGAERMSNAAV